MNSRNTYKRRRIIYEKNKGITLIALVITIIVLLILAGVTIATLTGDNGLLQKATTAKQENEDSKELELIKLAVSAAQVAGEGKITTGNLNTELQANLNDTNTTATEIKGGWSYKSYKIETNGNVYKLLPEEYQQLEYIKSTGTQYINTDIFSTNAKIQIKFKYNEINNKSQVLVNCRGDTSGWFGLNYKGDIIIGAGAHSCSFNNSFNDINYFEIEYKNNNITCTNEYGDIQQVSETPNTNFTLLAAGNSFCSLADIYSSKIYSNNIVVRDYIPCYNKESGKVGLYDLVGNQFFSDAAGGNFEAGPEV